MAPFIGWSSYIAFGIASTWGTAVARTNWLEMISENIQCKVVFDQPPHLGAQGQQSRVPTVNRYIKSKVYAGEVVFMGSYNDATLLVVANVLGGAGIVTDAGAGPYTHTMTTGAASVASMLTMAIGRGTGEQELFDSVVITSLKMEVVSGELMKFTAGIIAHSSTVGALASPTFPAVRYAIKHDDFVKVTINANDYTTVTRWALSVDQNFAARQLLGDTKTAQPMPAGFANISLDLDLEYASDTLAAEYLAGTKADVTGSFVDATNSCSMAYTLKNCTIVDLSNPVSGPGVIKRSVRIMPQAGGISAAQSGLAMVWTNANALYSSNG